MHSNLSDDINTFASGQITCTERRYQRHYNFSESFLGFQGHFPGKPILPAVVQMMICREITSGGLGITLSLTNVKRAKFMSLVKPGEDITAVCDLDIKDEVYTAKCHLEVKGEKVSSFILTFIADKGGESVG